MNARIFRSLVASIAIECCSALLYAADAPAPGPAAANRSSLPIKELLGIAKGLEIDPKVITATDGNGTTIGVHYKYDRPFIVTNALKTDIEGRIHSEGLVVVEQEKSPNRLLTHGLRFSAIDLLPSREITDSARTKQIEDLNQQIRRGYFLPWKNEVAAVRELKAANPGALSPDKKAELDERNGRIVRYVDQARPLLAPYGDLQPDETNEEWLLNDGRGESQDFQSVLKSLITKERVVFLSFDLDGDAETDQTFSDVQLVGSAQLRAKVLVPFLDLPFQMLRGGPAKNPLNSNNGPHLWGGLALVDASGNDSRMAITTRNENFARAHFGVFYRTEVFSTTAANAVALELQWRYYHEFNAPRPLRTRHLDNTSYFKATLLFPGNYFLEYTDGKLPLDVEGASTVSVGWRHNF